MSDLAGQSRADRGPADRLVRVCPLCQGRVPRERGCCQLPGWALAALPPFSSSCRFTASTGPTGYCKGPSQHPLGLASSPLGRTRVPAWLASQAFSLGPVSLLRTQVPTLYPILHTPKPPLFFTWVTPCSQKKVVRREVSGHMKEEILSSFKC